MDLQGRIIAVLSPREGTSDRGPWKSQEYVIETHEQYPKKMVFNVFGADRIEQFSIKLNEEVKVSFDIDAHEYNGRWFNSIRAWDIQHLTSNIPQPQYQQPTQPTYQPPQVEDDTPFEWVTTHQTHSIRLTSCYVQRS